MKDIDYIYKVQKDISLLSSVYSLLDWDMSTNLPSGAYIGRSEQMALLDNLIYERISSARLFSCLKRLKNKELSKHDSLVVDELYKQVFKQRKITKTISANLESQRAICNSSWVKAREANDFSLFVKDLGKMISLKKKYAHIFDGEDYDVLLDENEPGMSVKKLDSLFSYLKKELKNLLNDIENSKSFGVHSKAEVHLGISIENKIITHYLNTLGIPYRRVSVSTSVHPFTSRVSKNDVRITTENKAGINTFFSAAHEAGHALYDLGLPKEFNHTVLFDGASTGLHESQSTLWEQKIAKSEAFWKGYFSVFKEFIAKKYTWKEFYYSINRVRPSLIRTDADEITYILHIILRYEIEKEIFSGELSVEDIPKRWKEKSIELLGIEPKDDIHGPLQDPHWADGDFGYFPTYAIGLVYSAQIYMKLKEVFPNLDNLIESQNFHPISEWLHENIHKYGKTISSEKIINKACGEGLNPKILVAYLREKYLDIYK